MLKYPIIMGSEYSDCLDKNPQNFGSLGLLLLPFSRFLRKQHLWIDRYLPDQISYWGRIKNRLINEWDSNGLDLSQYGPEELSLIIELSLKFSNQDLEKRQRFAIAALWQMLNQKASLGENFESQIRTGNDSYKEVERLGSVAKIIFKDRDSKLAEAFVFGFGDVEQVFKADEKLFQFLEKYLPFIRSLYQDSKSQDYTRNVNEGLYLRHILRTMVLADEFYRQLKEKGVELNYEVLTIAAALHDAIEISKKNGGEITKGSIKLKLEAKGFSSDDSEKISQIVEFLVPQGDNPSYFEKKKQDFDRIWDGKGLSCEEKDWWEANKDYLRIIKAADVLANLEETVDDLKKGREDGRMKRSLVERFKVFEYRVAKINRWLKEIGFGQQIEKNEALLNDLLNRMPRFKKLRELNLSANTEFKYVVVGNKLIIAPGRFYDHNKMGYNDCKGGVFILNEGIVSFVRGASSVEPDNDGQMFFSWLSESREGEIKILQLNRSNPVAGLTNE